MSHDPFASGKAKDTSFAINTKANVVIPEGQYIGKLIELEKATSKNNNDMWVWTFVGMVGDAAGKEFKMYTAMTDAAMFKVEQTVVALGLGTVDDGMLVANFDYKDAINRMAVMTIEHQEYQGRATAKLAGIEPHPDGAGTMAPAAGAPV